MRVTYRIFLEQDITLYIPDKEKVSLLKKEIEVDWKVDKDNKLKELFLIFYNVPYEDIYYDKHNFPRIPTLEKSLYNIASYIANQIRIETGLDVIELDFTELMSIDDISAETIEEKQREIKEWFLQIPVKTNIIKSRFEPLNFSNRFNLSEAFAFYADSRRVLSPFTRYEQLFKIVEYFFCDAARRRTITDTVAQEISVYVQQYDDNYDIDTIKRLRDRRHQIIHPHADRGHLNPTDIDATRTLQSDLPLLQKLVSILLENPPSNNSTIIP